METTQSFHWTPPTTFKILCLLNNLKGKRRNPLFGTWSTNNPPRLIFDFFFKIRGGVIFISVFMLILG